jgi:class 3 adenylate cyclase
MRPRSRGACGARGHGRAAIDGVRHELRDRINAMLEGALIAIYRRHREHISMGHSTNHTEAALEQAGLHERQPRPHTICFVDLTGYARITEERGDEVAARFAGELSSLVEDISFRRGGRPIRWLGDEGMFHFKEPQAAVAAGLDMVEGAPARGLPPTHIGIHTGPVVFPGWGCVRADRQPGREDRRPRRPATGPRERRRRRTPPVTAICASSRSGRSS